MKKILIGSPICQEYDILNEFLISLNELDKSDLVVHYYFVDDNKDERSKKILKEFSYENDNVKIMENEDNLKYLCDNNTHRWNNELIEKVSRFKNAIIEYAKENNYDYLFFIDSDIVLHPQTLKRLISVDKDIVSNIFWTKWNLNTEELPQVWLKDVYTLHNTMSNEAISGTEAKRRQEEFLDMLRKPGTYRVGGLGACTLINKKSILSGVNFNYIHNISFWGEDRHFCIRAAVLGLELWVDTFYPAYHIYRKGDLAGIKNYKKNNRSNDETIIKSEIFSLIEKAVGILETYEYDEPIDNSWEEYFTKAAISKVNYKYKKNIEKLRKDKCKYKGTVKECEIVTLNVNENRAKVKFKIIYDGYKNEYTYHKEFKGRVNLQKEVDLWKINELIIDKEIMPMSKPFMRRVQENNKITLSMIVKNEANRYLERVLKSALEYIDNAVIIDDCSEDNTADICENILKDIPHKIIKNSKSEFSNEINLRRQQWDETIKTDPNWIVFLDADEIFENKFKDSIKILIKSKEIDSLWFRLYDFWDENHYRDDKYWCAHNYYKPFMVRYQPNFKYEWKETAQHCGRMPMNINLLNQGRSDLRLKHLGWAKESDRVVKYKRYKELDPECKYGWKEQYESILDLNPNLVKWIE